MKRMGKRLVLLLCSIALFCSGCAGGDGSAATTTQAEATTTTVETGTTDSTQEMLTSTQTTTSTTVKATTETTKKTTTTRITIKLTKTTDTEKTTIATELDNTTEVMTTMNENTTVSTTSSRRTVSRKTTTTTKSNFAQVTFPVAPKYATPALSALAVNNRINGAKTKIKSERSLVAEYDPEWAFAHQNGITYFKGKYYVGWSSGVRHEDAAGQRILVASSSDNCQTWSEPTVVAVPEMGTHGQKTLLFAQFVATDDMLYVYFIEHEYGASHFDSNGNFIAKDDLEVIASRSVAVFTSDGVNWTEQIELGGNSNESPRQSLTGKWFSGAGDGLNIWDDKGEYRVKWSNLSTQQVADARSRGAELLTEASWYQTDDYVMHMMLRSNAGYVWMSESYDNGETWTDAYPTKFTTDHAMFNFGRLPDGRYYFVGSSTMQEGEWRRYPLELFVSEDGYNFNKAYILRDEKYQMQQQGWSKGGYFGYPEVFIHDGYMHISYSKEKEVIEVTRVKLSDIL
ncbi:MAG: exo-alpha-sialidase [Clostridia bacterium]|nr:exo-alpha-sialidase [Clostridia bacterium]